MTQFGSLPPGSTGFGQAAVLTFNSDTTSLNSGNNDLDHGGQIGWSQYLDDVLDGASPVDIVDHGIGPFEDKTRQFQPSSFGVVCIANIPYAVTKSEIEHFLGKNASMIAHNEQGCSIHIIMERPTSKTMDCYVELMTHDAAVDAFQKHENLVMSGKHPRVGTRHVDVLISSQDELLKAIFPRARGLVWESGVPHKTENHDPYSAGFQGFFTREEMIGMYRHAETPQRSPFSVKCLQRTFECMISTLYKFPWHAQHMFTLEDRAQLFDCYMKQLGVLTSKVAEAQTVGLDTKLLIDFVSAGLNCVGFGERMRYMIAAHSGQVGASFPINRKSAAWPFDVLSVPFLAPDGQRWWFQHEGTLDLLIYIIELGHHICGNDYVHNESIKILPPSPPSAFDQDNLTSLRFEFREEVTKISYDEVISRETKLMRQLLELGFAKWADDMRSAWKDGRFNSDMQRDVGCMAGLQKWDQRYGALGRLSLSESPKGTPMAVPERYADYDNAPDDQNDGANNSVNTRSTPRLSRAIDPTVDAFEPQGRRNSEPAVAQPHDDIPQEDSAMPSRSKSSRDLAVFDTTLRRSQSLALEIKRPDGAVILSPSGNDTVSQSTVGPIGGHRTSVNRSPLKPRHGRGAFSVDQTIHEESEDEENVEIIMTTGRSRRATNAG